MEHGEWRWSTTDRASSRIMVTPQTDIGDRHRVLNGDFLVTHQNLIHHQSYYALLGLKARVVQHVTHLTTKFVERLPIGLLIHHQSTCHIQRNPRDIISLGQIDNSLANILGRLGTAKRYEGSGMLLKRSMPISS
jgi:hypothetical protein